MHYQEQHSHNIHIIYDPALIGDALGQLFCDESARRLQRGSARFFAPAGVARGHQRSRRGGRLGRGSQDTYQYRHLGCTRMWCEFLLLMRMRELGLPVPRPVAARVQRTIGGLRYRGDLITVRLAGTRTLTQWLTAAPLPPETWRATGAMLARFHGQQVYHADLNAHNILLDDEGGLFLVDFDKGAIRQGERWKATTLQRLRRSLDKLQHSESTFHFDESAWQSLLTGYYDPATASHCP